MVTLVNVPRGLANVVASRGNPARGGVSMTKRPGQGGSLAALGLRDNDACFGTLDGSQERSLPRRRPGDCRAGPEPAADGVLARASDANTRTAVTDAIMRGEALRIEFPLLMPPCDFLIR